MKLIKQHRLYLYLLTINPKMLIYYLDAELLLISRLKIKRKKL